MKGHSRKLISVIRRIVGEPIQGAEVGVWRGGMALALLSTFPDLELTMVDPWLPHEGKTAEEMQAIKQEALDVTQFADDRRFVMEMSSRDAVADLLSDLEFSKSNLGLFDFVFIDADHRYEHVKQDVEMWTPLVRSEGIVSGHDYGGMNDKRGVWGIKRAVDEYANEHGCVVGHDPRTGVWWFVKE